MKKLFDFLLIMGCIGSIFSIINYNDCPTFYSFMTIFIFVSFMFLGLYGSVEEDKHEIE